MHFLQLQLSLGLHRVHTKWMYFSKKQLKWPSGNTVLPIDQEQSLHLQEVHLLLGCIIITHISSNILSLKSIKWVLYVWHWAKRFMCIISFYRAVYSDIHSFIWLLFMVHLWCTIVSKHYDVEVNRVVILPASCYVQPIGKDRY